MKGLIKGLPTVVMRVRFKDGIRQNHYPRTKDYYADSCIGAFLERSDALDWVTKYVHNQTKAYESLGWRYYIERNRHGEVTAYSVEKNGTAYLTRFYLRSADPNI